MPEGDETASELKLSLAVLRGRVLAARLEEERGEYERGVNEGLRIAEQLVADFDRDARARIGEEAAHALGELRAKGRKTGGAPPYGYALADDDTTLVPDAGERKLASEIRRLREAGMSFRAIARTLEERGLVFRKRKNRLDPTQVRLIMMAADLPARVRGRRG